MITFYKSDGPTFRPSLKRRFQFSLCWCFALISLLFCGSPLVSAIDGNVEKSVETLLDRIAKSNAVFIRNGSDHTGPEASKHLKAKFEHFRKEILTAEDFIRLAATKSMISGKPYLVKFQDGKTMPLADWLAQQLKAEP